MSYINVSYCNHTDLTWRRPRYTAAHIDGCTLIPYTELQEKQMDAGFDFARSGGCYSIEQTIPLREYIARNPDTEEEIAQMIKDGRVVVLGGGESVVDYNLPDGESLVRNHLYSRRYLKEKFGYTPKIAACPDTFGLSAGLPTLFRALGYPGVAQFGRIFENCKPIWRGVSGERIALCTRGNSRPGRGYGAFIKLRVCGVCMGEGCPSCGGLGFMESNAPDKAAELDKLTQIIKECIGEGDFNISFGGEENAVPAGIYAKLCEISKAVGAPLRFVGQDYFNYEADRELFKTLDTASEDLIDERAEGNPVATGCYTTRIPLKQENRRCEAMLRAAERLSVEASLYGMKYPAGSFQYLWNKMSFLHFHDALPASHSDDAYAELMETGRQVRASASRLINRALGVLVGHVGVSSGEGQAFAVFNPLEFDVHGALLTGSVEAEEYVDGGYVIAPDGSRHEVLSLTHDVQPQSKNANITFYGDLPAFGYAVFRFVPAEEEIQKPQTVRRGVVMENEFLKVVIGTHCIESITDKRDGRVIAKNGTFAPLLSDDSGHPWGRMSLSQYSDRADRPTFHENMMPALKSSHEVKYCRRGEVQIAEIYVTYARREKQIDELCWKCELRLADGSDELKVKIDAKLDARDIKLSTMLVLPEAPADGRLDYEIPLGRIARGKVNDFNAQLGFADEWPALRYVSAKVGGKNITLCNSGTPAHSIDGNTVKVSLIRTPTLMCCGYGFDGAIDKQTHTFDFTLSVNGCVIDEYRRGMTLNSIFPAIAVASSTGKDASASFMALPASLPVLALKGAEDGDGIICRYLGVDTANTVSFDAPVTVCSVLEEDETADAREVEVKPYAIKTLRLKGEDVKTR